MKFDALLVWVLLTCCSMPEMADAETIFFVVSETALDTVRGDSYVLGLEDASDIEHARNLIAKGPSGGRAIIVADIAPGSDGINRDVLAPGAPQWSWHVVDFESFADATIEILDGSPTIVEEDVGSWMQNTGGVIGFWRYTVTAELKEQPPFLINPGLNDAWFNPETDGQGFFISVFPDIGLMFLAWFTYEVERPDESIPAQLGEAGHRWLTAQGAYAGNQAVLDIYIARGGVFNTSPPEPVLNMDGTITIEFSNCNAGTVTYDIPSIGRQGVIPIERIALDNVSLCESFAAGPIEIP